MFGKRLRDLREENDLTQKQLGLNLHLSQRAISAYENSERFPPENTLNLIADYFDVSLDYLFCRTNIKNVYKQLK